MAVSDKRLFSADVVCLSVCLSVCAAVHGG